MKKYEIHIAVESEESSRYIEKIFQRFIQQEDEIAGYVLGVFDELEGDKE